MKRSYRHLKPVMKDIAAGRLMELITPLRFSEKTKKMFPRVGLMVIDSDTFDRRVKNFDGAVELIEVVNRVCENPESHDKERVEFEWNGWRCFVVARRYPMEGQKILNSIFLGEVLGAKVVPLQLQEVPNELR